MKVIRKIWLSSLLVVTTLFMGNLSASLIYLPDSSYEDGAWQGFTSYEEGDFKVRIDFAVYDTNNLQYSGETELADELDMHHQYIYVYQIFNAIGDYKEVGYFEILDINGDEIAQALMDETGSLDDRMGGVAPIDPSPKEGVWEFSWGVLVAGTHSYVLALSSDQEPTRGTYEIDKPRGVAVVSPEPGMIALLGIGSGILFSRRRRAVQ